MNAYDVESRPWQWYDHAQETTEKSQTGVTCTITDIS